MNVAFALAGLTLVLYKGIFYAKDPMLKNIKAAKLPQSKNAARLAVLIISSE